MVLDLRTVIRNGRVGISAMGDVYVGTQNIRVRSCMEAYYNKLLPVEEFRSAGCV